MTFRWRAVVVLIWCDKNRWRLEALRSDRYGKLKKLLKYLAILILLVTATRRRSAGPDASTGSLDAVSTTTKD
jgi:hypothetical protein